MPVSEDKTPAPKKADKPRLARGHHVLAKDNTHLGSYDSEEGARAYIDAHAPDAQYYEGEDIDDKEEGE